MADVRRRSPETEQQDVVVASVACRVRPAKRRECCSAFERLLERTRCQPGCLDARLASDFADDEMLTMISEWTDRVAYEEFVASDAFGVIKGMRFLMTSGMVVVVDEVISRARSAVL